MTFSADDKKTVEMLYFFGFDNNERNCQKCRWHHSILLLLCARKYDIIRQSIYFLNLILYNDESESRNKIIRNYNSVKSTKGNRHVHKKMDSGAERTVRCSQFDSRLRTSYERIPK